MIATPTIPMTKNEQITALALEVLEDTEMSRTSVESLVLKASRLARLVDDEESQLWLWHERHGYDNTGKVSLKYLGLTNRWIDVSEKTGYFAPINSHEAMIESLKEQLDIVKKYVPSGTYSGLQLKSYSAIKPGRFLRAIKLRWMHSSLPPPGQRFNGCHKRLSGWEWANQKP
jgi:hypothetical protein